MKTSTLFFLLLIASVQPAIAQPKLLTMEEAVVKQNTSLAPAKLHQLMWIEKTDSFSYVEKSKNFLMIGHAAETKQDTTVSLSQLNEELIKLKFKPLESFPQIQWENATQFTFETEKKLLARNIKTNTVTILGSRDFGPDAENPDVAPKTNYIAFNVKNNLVVYNGKEKVNVSNDTNGGIVNGRIVHREEFGISKGTFWSPNGNLLAFYRMDETMVTDYPIIDWTVRPAKNINIKYPMAGDKSHEVTVGIFNVQTQKIIFLKTGEPKEQYLTNLAWSPDEKQIYIAVLNRDQNHMKLKCYNAISGIFEKTLFEEKHEKYIQPLHPMEFVSGNSNQFIWQSERDGFNHLYLYSVDGTLIKQVTKGNWLVTDFAGFDSKGTKVFFTGTAESPITRNFYSADLKTGTINRITSGDGMHIAMISPGRNFILDDFQSTTIPRDISVYDVQGKKIQVLTRSENSLSTYLLGELSIFTLKNDNGDDLYCRLYKPANFDSTKKYPAIVYLYGGPNVQLIKNSWNGGGDLWFQYMAERGYVVFSLDSRGSSNRGLAFEQAIFQHLGAEEIKDQLIGISFLKKQPYVDAARMGLFGWSFGGFLTTSIMTKHPDIFKAAVAGGPVIDWSYYEVMYTERYMDTPQTNKSGYDETNVLNFVDGLKGKLMLIHGTQDPVVVWEHSIMFLKACVDKKKQVDYFVYPGYEHNVRGKDREHLYQKVTDYFMQNL